MYQTTLKSVKGNFAIGSKDERLQFIGNFPAKVGDIVWTDGKVIFGHTPPRAAPIVLITQDGGIPILSDNLRGYFTKKGVWKNYDVLQADWITNGKNNFTGGEKVDTSTGQKIFDAEISDEGGLFYVKWNDFVRWLTKSDLPVETIKAFPAFVYSNNKQLAKIDLSTVTAELYDIWLDMRKRIKKKYNQEGWQYDADKPPYATITEILSIDVDKSGNYEYYIFGSMLGVVTTITQDADSYKFYPEMCSSMYRISGGKTEQISYHSVGSNTSDYKSGEYNFRQKAGEGFFLMDKFGRMKIYNADSEIVAENIPVDENFCHIEIKSLSENTSRDNIIINYEVFTPDGNTETKRNKISDFIGKCSTFETSKIPAMEGFYLKDKDGYLTPFNLRPVLKKINGGYLFGNYGGDLYLKLNENVQKIDGGLKNFRLEELKIIKKSKVG